MMAPTCIRALGLTSTLSLLIPFLCPLVVEMTVNQRLFSWIWFCGQLCMTEKHTHMARSASHSSHRAIRCLVFQGQPWLCQPNWHCPLLPIWQLLCRFLPNLSLASSGLVTFSLVTPLWPCHHRCPYRS